MFPAYMFPDLGYMIPDFHKHKKRVSTNGKDTHPTERDVGDCGHGVPRIKREFIS
jgi:hypothetical protein